MKILPRLRPTMRRHPRRGGPENPLSLDRPTRLFSLAVASANVPPTGDNSGLSRGGSPSATLSRLIPTRYPEFSGCCWPGMTENVSENVH